MSAPLETFGVSRCGDKHGPLHMEDVALSDVAAMFGTPTFVYSRAALTASFARLNDALKKARKGKP